MQPDQIQYDFILNPNDGQQPKKSLVPKGLSKKKKIMFGAGGFMVLLVLVLLIASLFSGGPSNKDQLLKVVAQQNELIRVSDIALKEAKGTAARNMAMTTKLSLRSDQSTLIAALKKQKVKVGGAELSATKSSKTDELLTTAAQNNRFDEAYLEFVQEELSKYQKSIAAAYQTTESKSLRETMRVQTQNASVIIGADPEG